MSSAIGRDLKARNGNFNFDVQVWVKFFSSLLAESVEARVRLASIAADHRAQLVVFPELSLTGYTRGLTSRDATAAGGQPLTPLQDVTDARDVVVQVAGHDADTALLSGTR